MGGYVFLTSTSLLSFPILGRSSHNKGREANANGSRGGPVRSGQKRGTFQTPRKQDEVQYRLRKHPRVCVMIMIFRLVPLGTVVNSVIIVHSSLSRSVHSEREEQDREEKKRNKSLGQSLISQSQMCLPFRSRSCTLEEDQSSIFGHFAPLL